MFKLEWSWYCAVFISLFLLTPLPGSAKAQERKPPDGFSGFVTFLAGAAEVESQFQTDSGNRVNNSLASSGESTTFIVPMVLFDIGYMVADWQAQFFVGIPSDNVREGEFFHLEVGVRHWLSDNTKLTASIVPAVLIPDETWSDPFLLGSPRQETDIDAKGIKLRADNIAGSMWGVRYEFLNWDIDNERSGQSLPLTPGQRQLLARDADYHRLTATYTVSLGDSWFVRPALRYVYADADGDSNSYNAIRPEIGVLYDNPAYDFSVNAQVEKRWFDEDNPIYGKARDDTLYKATVAYGYKKPLGWEQMRLEFLATAAYGDSDIDFYDSKFLYLGSGLTYFF